MNNQDDILTPTQSRFAMSNNESLIWSGAIASGKSFALTAGALRGFRNPGTMHSAIICPETSHFGRANHVSRIARILTEHNVDFIDRQQVGARIFELSNGNKVSVISVSTSILADMDRLIRQRFTFVGIDNLEDYPFLTYATFATHPNKHSMRVRGVYSNHVFDLRVRKYYSTIARIMD